MSTFILVHGAWGGAWSWDNVVPHLVRAGHTVLVPELPGHGADRTPVAEISLQSYVNTVGRLVEQQAAPVVLVGHSMAGAIISEVAERFPDRVAQLIYVAGYLLESGQSVSQASEAATDSLVGPNMVFAPDYSTIAIKSEAAREVFAADAKPEDLERAQQLLRPEPSAPFNTPVNLTPERFGRTPRDYIRTTRDRAVPSSLQDAMLAKLPCRRVLSMDTSHTPFFAAPEQLAANLIELSKPVTAASPVGG